MSPRRWLRALAVVVVAVLTIVGLAGSASGAVAGTAETRVGASSVVVEPVTGPPKSVSAGQRLGHEPTGVVVVVATGVATKSVPDGIVYQRTDQLGGKPYVGQAMSESRYLKRQSEHARANPDADFEFEIIGRANPGTELDRLEEFYIRRGGGPTNLSNPSGGLANRRHQMSDSRYWEAGGDLW